MRNISSREPMTAHEQTKTKPLEMTMKTIATALIALSVLTGAVAAPAAADFSIKQLDQDGRGGHQN